MVLLLAKEPQRPNPLAAKPRLRLTTLKSPFLFRSQAAIDASAHGKTSRLPALVRLVRPPTYARPPQFPKNGAGSASFRGSACEGALSGSAFWPRPTLF